MKRRDFDVAKAVSYWLDGAKYDMESAHDVYSVGRYPYALFLAHMALEKALKALYVRRTRRHAPQTHSLTLLARQMRGELPADLVEKLAGYAGFHIQTRYPDYLFEFYDHCTPEFTRRTLEEMEGVFQWLIRKLNG